ncbi:uncharacterized protein LOC113291315 [Papaver somniferum]|uniref:uncharacterized protein LOC113291315 n=1 Tax=Papaver somniferum TaxID=3469 RepID=UPI000E6FA163|nr:uncharacterized protein LOC113291315 [Papaver somniferum]
MIQSLYIDLNKEDEVICMPAKNGSFSVKSTDNMLTKDQCQVQVNGNIISSAVWKNLWNYNTAHRIKLFAWKCIRELNSTRYKLAYYDSNIEVNCGVCGQQEETMEHLIFMCSHARSVWRGVQVDIEDVSRRFSIVSEWAISWFSDRNYNNNVKHLLTLMIGISTMLPRDICTSLWIPPEIGVFKFNIDASFDPDTNQLGTGIVLRDYTGECKGIRGEYASGVLSAKMGECMAIREALSWAKRMQCSMVQVEADAKLVIQSINRVSLLIQWENRNLIKEIKHLALSFTRCIFSFTKRENNRVADIISKTVRESATGIKSFSNFSTVVCDLLAKDQIKISIS